MLLALLILFLKMLRAYFDTTVSLCARKCAGDRDRWVTDCTRVKTGKAKLQATEEDIEIMS